MGTPGAPGRRSGARRVAAAVLAAALVAVSGLLAPAPALAATPVLSTQASASGFPAGVAIFDVATLGQGENPTGTITFDLYGPDNPTCAGAPIFTSTKPVAGNGIYQSDSFTTNAAGTYQWLASYSGDANNTAVTTACDDPKEAVIVARRTPTLSTQASPGGPVGTPITDTATLGNGAGPAGPTGTITFDLYGPDNLTCAGPPIFTSTKAVAGNGTYQSDPFTPTAPGSYRWLASYTGDANNFPATTICADPAEEVVITGGTGPLTPTLTTTASPGGAVGGQLTDTATLAGGNNPSGTISFSLFGPDDATCAAPAVFTSSEPVSGNGTYTSDPFTTTAPGTYRWVAAYSGDAGNNPVTTACNDPAETVVVTAGPGPVTPTLTTTASPGVELGGQVTDTATLAGGNSPTGTITFSLFGPNNPTCGGAPTFTNSKGVSGNGTYTSDPFTPTAAGTYQWVAAYSGDANNNPVTTACNDPAESVTVSATGLPPFSATAVPPTALVGDPVTDQATLSGLADPTGTITFQLFGPADPTCAGTPVFTSTRAVSGNGTYTSDPFVVDAPGNYRWSATYSGDANNPPATVSCSDPQQLVAVALTVPDLTTTASPSVPVGGEVFDTAVLANGRNPTGTITFDLYPPGFCGGTPVFISTRAVTGNGTYTSDPFTPTTPGIYQWVATYSGDPLNSPVATVCGDQEEQVVVTSGGPGALAVTKTAEPASLPAPGGEFRFNVSIFNSGGQAVAITGVTDDVYGDLSTRPDSTCNSLIGAVIVPETGAGCMFTVVFTGPPGTTQTDTVTVTGIDALANPTTASDSATIAITGVASSIVVDKTAAPGSRPEPGGVFTFGVTVTNTGTEGVILTGLADDVHGPLAGQGTCALGAFIPPGGAYGCSFDASFTGNARASETDTVTATALSAGGLSASASDSATIVIADVAPTVAVSHTVNPRSLPEPGGSFLHTVTVTNTGSEPVRILSLGDSVHGDLATGADSTCGSGPGHPLAPGETYACTFTTSLTGEAGARQTSTVFAVVVDDDGTTATGSATATWSLTDVPPQVDVDLAVTPQSRPEPGGTFTFTVTVRNTSNPETVTIRSLASNIHGNLDGRGTCRTGVVLPPPPDPASVYTCSFTAAFTGNAGDRQTVKVSVTVVDNEGTTASDISGDLEGTIVLTDVAPQVTVDKLVQPDHLPEPGGTFQFTVAVRNTGTETFEILSIADDVYGDLDGQGSCRAGVVLGAGDLYRCSFPGTFTGTAGATQTDVVTVTVADDDGTQAVGRDAASVTLVGAGTPPPAAPPEPSADPAKSPLPPAVPAAPSSGQVAFTGMAAAWLTRAAAGMVLIGLLAVAATSQRRRGVRSR